MQHRYHVDVEIDPKGIATFYVRCPECNDTIVNADQRTLERQIDYAAEKLTRHAWSHLSPVAVLRDVRQGVKS